MKTTRSNNSGRNSQVKGNTQYQGYSDEVADPYDNSDELIVIKDTANNKEYFLSVVDNFVLNHTEYIVMYNYAPDDGTHSKPELVIMRTVFGEKGTQQFVSIKDRKELNDAFDCFMRRFYSAEGK
ncbi:MAG: DUF1292 domain-containing protein [Clostridia bacterium]|nr:DUF1292 domain-containing protein [Clostridia bacterium]